MAASDESAIRDLIERQTAAMKAKDAAAVMNCYTTDSVSFGLAPPLVSSNTEAEIAAWFAGRGGPMEYRVTRLSVTASGDVAFARSLNRMGTDEPGPGLWFRVTLGLQRIDGT